MKALHFMPRTIAITFLIFISVFAVWNSRRIVEAATDKIVDVVITNWPTDPEGNIKVREQGIADVRIANTSPIPIEVITMPPHDKWEYWYQCHPTATNEAEIRNYLNARGSEGWEVVAAANGGGTIVCEYYKRAIQ